VPRLLFELVLARLEEHCSPVYGLHVVLLQHISLGDPVSGPAGRMTATSNNPVDADDVHR
jgi:hypothetical protein